MLASGKAAWKDHIGQLSAQRRRSGSRYLQGARKLTSCVAPMDEEEGKIVIGGRPIRLEHFVVYPGLKGFRGREASLRRKPLRDDLHRAIVRAGDLQAWPGN